MNSLPVLPALRHAYAAALGVHAAILMMLLGSALVRGPGGADAAPDSLIFAGLKLMPVLLGALPSAVALLSWYLCRRQNASPSQGHMALAIAVAATWMLLFFWAVLT